MLANAGLATKAAEHKTVKHMLAMEDERVTEAKTGKREETNKQEFQVWTVLFVRLQRASQHEAVVTGYCIW